MKSFFPTGVISSIAFQGLCQASSHGLNADASFAYDLLTGISQAGYGAADPGDFVALGLEIQPSNFSSWNESFYRLARDTQAKADISKNANPEILRDTYFAASTYWREVDFYLHGNPDDPWINETWVHQQYNYDKAMALMNVPGERLTLPADGFDVYAIYYGADDGNKEKNIKRPTLVLLNGYDGSQEGIYFTLGVTATQLGYNVITYEGPGQPSVRRNQSLGFINDWDRTLTPVLDYLEARDDVDTEKIIYFGFSFGGYLAARAGAIENSRLAGLALDGGIWNVFDAFLNQLPSQLKQVFLSGNEKAFNSAVNTALANSSTPSGLRWGVEQGMWSFMIDTPYDFLDHLRGWNVSDIISNITIPTWITNADNDQFFEGQPLLVANALSKTNKHVTVQNYTGTAGNHCQSGAYETLNRDFFSWVDSVLNQGL